jgi:hypothetical protein
MAIRMTSQSTVAALYLSRRSPTKADDRRHFSLKTL